MTSADRPLAIAILAMGNQGGGTLTDWIVSAAEAHGWHAQSTSVPGVAQRTGATLYYIEMMPAPGGRAPVFALMPSPGDVDIVIAAELMEAGRAMLRGLADPARTLLVTSTHRAYAVAEKEAPGSAIGDPRAVAAAAGVAAHRVIAFDMDDVARRAGTVISAPLLGALAGSGALPFPRQTFEAAIDGSARHAEASRQGFAAGFARATRNELTALGTAPGTANPGLPASLGRPDLDVLLQRLATLPEDAQVMALAGLKRVVDFQDVAYGAQYLDRLTGLAARDDAAGGAGEGHAFTVAAARHLANAMAYDDVIGVADLKTRRHRFDRIARDMGKAGDPLALTEFMHPGAGELVGLLPVGLGRRLRASPKSLARIDRLFGRGRRIRTTTITGFLQLYALAGLRRFRRRLLRHADEMQHLERWLEEATRHLATDYGLAVGILKARRLVKGYADTHSRGLSKFDRVLSAAGLLAGRADAGDWMARLVTAALKDEKGDALDGALATLRSL